ncbi:hypothetical protein M514_18701 [Trichuris suis]|uniref:Uncharacterized protein n=1 Tax=Trichuris suis TaxID=68888 RepID=A0A085NI28_9BILA|nr:hypothetical protein M514_18701 [Trichuris suis]
MSCVGPSDHLSNLEKSTNGANDDNRGRSQSSLHRKRNALVGRYWQQENDTNTLCADRSQLDILQSSDKRIVLMQNWRNISAAS